MAGKHIFWITSTVVVLVLASVLVWYRNYQDGKPSRVAELLQARKPGIETTESVPSRFHELALVGGVHRPRTDVQLGSPGRSEERTPPKKRQGFPSPQSPDTNQQVRQIVEALNDERQKPERFSSFVVSRNFDAARFKDDPAAYAAKFAEVVEPGRVFAPAQPGDDVPVIRPTSKRFTRVLQGETVLLSAQATAHAPVTFTSQKLGHFKNMLTSITVVAGNDGVAKARFTAAGGTIGNLPILAASPVTSGQARFFVSVLLPK